MLLSVVVLLAVTRSFAKPRFATFDDDDDPNKMICYERLKDDIKAYWQKHKNDYIDIKTDLASDGKPCQRNICKLYVRKQGSEEVLKTVTTFEADYRFCGNYKVCLKGECRDGRSFCETVLKKDTSEAKGQGKSAAVGEDRKLFNADGPPSVCKTRCTIFVDGKEDRSVNVTSPDYDNCGSAEHNNIDAPFPFYCKQGVCVNPEGETKFD